MSAVIVSVILEVSSPNFAINSVVDFTVAELASAIAESISVLRAED